MRMTTVCNYCSYRFDFDSDKERTFCAICGAMSFTKDLLKDSYPCTKVEEC